MGGEDGLKFNKQLFVKYTLLSRHFACAARLLLLKMATIMVGHFPNSYSNCCKIVNV